MQLVLDIAIFIGSFLLIIWGGDRFVDSSVAIAKKIKIPPVVIGATLTSIGTTLPELLITIFSAGGESAGFAVGNALGSIIFNTCIIGGILVCFMTIHAKKDSVTEYLFLLILLAIGAVMIISGRLELWESIVLVIVFVVFTIMNMHKIGKEPLEKVEDAKTYTRKTWQHFLMFLVAAVAVGAGAFLMVDKAKLFCSLLGASETLVGVAVLSVGSSLPELITTINAIKKKQAGLGIGNIVGSNVINGSLLLGLAGIVNGFSGLPITKETIVLTMPLAILCSSLLFIPTLINKKTYKWQGFALIGIYLIYYVYLILGATGAIGAIA